MSLRVLSICSLFPKPLPKPKALPPAFDFFLRTRILIPACFLQTPVSPPRQLLPTIRKSTFTSRSHLLSIWRWFLPQQLVASLFPPYRSVALILKGASESPRGLGKIDCWTPTPASHSVCLGWGGESAFVTSPQATLMLMRSRDPPLRTTALVQWCSVMTTCLSPPKRFFKWRYPISPEILIQTSDQCRAQTPLKKEKKHFVHLCEQVKILNCDSTERWPGCRHTGSIMLCWWSCKWHTHDGRRFDSFFKKPEVRLAYRPVIALLDIYSREMSTCSHKNLYMIVHSSFICKSPRMKQPKCPSKSKWLSKRWYIYIQWHYSATERMNY